MKGTKLSLITFLTLGIAYAGGDIAPVEPMVTTPQPVAESAPKAEASATTIGGKLTGYYITDDTTNDLFGKHSQLGVAATFDVSHKLSDMFTLNFTAVGYGNALQGTSTTFIFPNTPKYFEGQKAGAFFNVANLTANFGDTTIILGRQLIDTPLVGGFDWLLAPGSFEAAVVTNSSIENLTLVGGYLTKWRANNTGDNWANLTSIDSGNNWTVGAVYGMDDLSVSAWYYNVDAGAAAGNPSKFTAIYADAGYKFGDVSVAGQVVSTNYNAAVDALTIGAKVEAELAGIGLMAAVNQNTDNQAGFVGRDSLYTSSWNSFASQKAVLNDSLLAWKVGASGELAGISAEASYADYDTQGNEFDVILGYGITNSIDAGVVYSLTDYTGGGNSDTAVEVFANYTF